jgi:hypothetical protein
VSVGAELATTRAVKHVVSKPSMTIANFRMINLRPLIRVTLARSYRPNPLKPLLSFATAARSVRPDPRNCSIRPSVSLIELKDPPGSRSANATCQSGEGRLRMTMVTHDIKTLDRNVTELVAGLKQLAQVEDLEELRLKIFPRPGWTTPAEFQLVAGALQNLHAQVQNVLALKQVVVKASRQIGV